MGKKLNNSELDAAINWVTTPHSKQELSALRSITKDNPERLRKLSGAIISHFILGDKAVTAENCASLPQAIHDTPGNEDWESRSIGTIQKYLKGQLTISPKDWEAIARHLEVSKEISSDALLNIEFLVQAAQQKYPCKHALNPPHSTEPSELEVLFKSCRSR